MRILNTVARPHRALALVALSLAGALLMASAAHAEAPAAPALTLTSNAVPTNFKPDGSEEPFYEVRMSNIGAAPTDGSPIVLTDTLPKGLTIAKVAFRLRHQAFESSEGKDYGEDESVCKKTTVEETATVTCTIEDEIQGSSVIYPGDEFPLLVYVGLPSGAFEEGDRLQNEVTVEGGGAPRATISSENEVSVHEAPPGFSEFKVSLTGPDGRPVTQAAAHPYQMTTSFALNLKRNSRTAENQLEPKFGPSGGAPKDTPVTLPPGLIGNPTATPRCPLQQFNEVHTEAPFPEDNQFQVYRNQCPEGSVVGYFAQRGGIFFNAQPVYNLMPPPGMPAMFGFDVLNLPLYIETEANPSDNYKIRAWVRNITEAKQVKAASITLWGNPADPRHDRLRGRCNAANPLIHSLESGNCPAGIPDKPFLRLPSDCASPFEIAMEIDSWLAPGSFASALSGHPAPTGCDALTFGPTLKATPTTNVADSPSGLEVDLHVPQPQEPEGLGTPDLRKAVVTLPEGMVANPSQANGLAACSEEQVGYVGEFSGGAARFDDEAAHCPDAARIGDVTVKTPLLDDPLQGGVYLASPHANPFGSLLALYLAVEDPERGVVVKLAGKVEADPVTGRLTTTFDQNPQLPFEDFELHFFKGAGAPLRTPPTCGSHSVTSQMTPWSAPGSGPPASPSDTWAIGRAPVGNCPTTASGQPNSPGFEAGTASPVSATYSPMVVNLSREDDSQEFGQITLTPPPGLLARLAGIPYCPDQALTAAAGRSGRAEEASPSCPGASRVGTAYVAAGAGPAPFHTSGAVYLAGPYEGAPLSLAIVTPAVAGPFDLGTVVVRTALHVDPETAAITAVSDPIPHILEGIPLDVRQISVRLDHDGWGLNPTDCEPLSFAGRLTSTQGQGAPLQSRFQVGECGRLGFKPKLKIQLKGQTRRTGHPGLKAVLTYPKSGAYANIGRAQVNLPHGEFLDQGNLNKTCTKPVLLAGNCPASTVYGRAKAWTPLLEKPLEGNVYLVGGYGFKLPALVAELDGQIKVLLVGKVDSGKNKGIRNTFEVVPDAPVSRFELSMKGGKKYGLLENSENLCKASKQARRAIARFTAQDGKVDQYKPVVANQCGKVKKHQKHHGRRGARR